MSTRHAVVWIDHEQAHVQHFDVEGSENAEVKSHSAHHHGRHSRDASGSSRAKPDNAFFADVATALGDSLEILVTGPAQAKSEFVSYVSAHAPAVASKIVGVEALDHPSEGQLLAFARKYFRAKDRLIGGS
ncbi:MAG: translational machinery protein [Burkholderiaceae bacterium]|jgi:stalled ribosome rescue protein Dom34